MGLFQSGYTELTAQLRAHPAVDAHANPQGPGGRPTLKSLSAVDRSLLRASAIEVNKLERWVSFLATTASIAPFIGLFGTVWGIMTAFEGIGQTGSTNLGVVAPGTEIGAALRRAPVDDVLVSAISCDLYSIPRNGIVATGSVRRKHQLHWKRPDLEIVDLHGNVPTRLRKFAKGQWHAVILARAGLERLGLFTEKNGIIFGAIEFAGALLPQEIFLPAGGQGAIAVQMRSDDDDVRMLVEAVNDLDTRLCLRAEREFLRHLHGDCNQPVGVLAVVNEIGMKLRAQIFDVGATVPREASIEGPSEDAERLAAALFAEIGRK